MTRNEREAYNHMAAGLLDGPHRTFHKRGSSRGVLAVLLACVVVALAWWFWPFDIRALWR